jgi:hypothetical protein
MASEALVTKEQFVRAMQSGPVVITSKSGSPRIHPARCDHLTLENFHEKVIRNGGRNGAYYSVRNKAEAQADWPGLVDCHGWA